MFERQKSETERKEREAEETRAREQREQDRLKKIREIKAAERKADAVDKENQQKDWVSIYNFMYTITVFITLVID